ncbi:MAG: Prefoldin beta subunit [Cenarchaeum symbiont of Oopsacas minuta]|nr:Prefoldin beta subunit [Cenarchaeum symbiont of Oopsacas minuta]
MPQNVPPWLREQIEKLQQTQQSLQAVLTQKQQIEIERAEIAKALEELDKVSDTDAVFKHAGSILVQSTKTASIEDLKERSELANTRITVMAKQEERLRVSLKEQDAKINEMIKGNPGVDSPQQKKT